MSKVEAKWNTLLNKYFKEKKFFCYYELKQTKDNSFSFSKIETNQIDGLTATEESGMVWKLSDEDQRKKPCDGFSTPPLPSYLIIKWPDGFYLIRFKEILDMIEKGENKISKEQAKKIAEKIIRIK
jgi:hypothetical protein